MPPDDFPDIRFTERQRKIVTAVLRAGKHGIATDRLFNSVWDDLLNGGPETGHKVLHVHISAINKQLRPRGWQLSGEHTGTRHAYGRYVLAKMPEEPAPPPEQIHGPYNLIETNWSTTPCP